MAVMAALVKRQADLQRRMGVAIAQVQENLAIPEPPAFPAVRDKQVKELQAFERLVMIMESVADRTATGVAEGKTDG